MKELNPTVDQLDAAARAWCATKSRETGLDDLLHFRNVWRSIPELTGFVKAEMRNEMQTEMDRLFMQSAMQLAKNSDDRSTQVGCVITDADDKVIGGGCNSFPIGVNPTPDERHERPEKYDWIEHAERNAIFDAARKGRALKGSKMHLPWFPCTDCARAVVQSGIVELVCHEPDFNDERWGAKFVTAHKILSEGGVDIRYVDPELALEDLPSATPAA